MIIQITFSEVAIKPLNHNSIFAYAGKKFCSCVQAVITGMLLLVTLLFLLLGVASITETSSQTVDLGQVEDTRWSEVSSDVVKVNVFFSC